MSKSTNILSSFFLLTLILLSSSSLAQQGVKVGFRVSPIAGAQSYESLDSLSDKPIKTPTQVQKGSIDLGIILSVGLTEKAALTTGLSYQRIGFSTSQPIPASANVVPDSTKKEISGLTTKASVTVPIGLKLRSPALGSSGLHVWTNMGGQVNFNRAYSSTQEFLVSETDRAGNTIHTIKEVKTEGAEHIEPITAALVPALGFDLYIGEKMLQAGVSYHWGLMSMTSRSSTSSATRTKLSYVALDLGYFF